MEENIIYFYFFSNRALIIDSLTNLMKRKQILIRVCEIFDIIEWLSSFFFLVRNIQSTRMGYSTFDLMKIFMQRYVEEATH